MRRMTLAVELASRSSPLLKIVADALLTRTDAAMCEAKRAGKAGA